MLRSDFDSNDFTWLGDDITVLGDVVGGEVDNYIYSLIATEEKEE